ncbi:MAG: Kelch repeat-containing protein [Candidatus Bathyarchaeales archaeon]
MSRFARIVGVTFFTLLVMYASLFWAEAATEDYWIAKAPVPSAVWGVVTLNGKIHAFGRNVTYEYDPLADIWTAKNPLSSDIYGSALAVYQNKIYIYAEGNGTTYAYDPAIGMWETKAPMPTPRGQLNANVVDGKIYLIGGRTGDNTLLALNEVYDVATDSWTTKAPIPNPVALYASAVVDNKIYIIGGQNEFTSAANFVQIYDPATDTWSFGTTMPTGVWLAAAGATSGVWAPKRIYVIGGLPAKSLDGTSLNQVYAPENDSWTVGASMPTARFQLHVAVVNDLMYAIGGLSYFNLQGIWCPETEQYTPIGYGTVPPVVAVISPESVTYNSIGVPLVFTVNKPVVWIGYRLDGQEVIALTGNTTLSGLANGPHSITVYARDEFGNTGASETITFNVETPFPIILVITTSVVAAAIIGIGFLIYHKKHRK